MNSTPKPPVPDLVRCEVCLREIPASEASIAEAQDYVAHFCGLDCYAKWKAQTARPHRSGQDGQSEPR